MRTVLDEYDIVTQVPTPGGMGLVYRTSRPSGEVIALKLIPLGRTADSEAIVRSERRGAQVQMLLGLKDSHVPRVYDFGEKHGVFFIEMEYVAGEDLSTILARTRTLPPADAARIAYEVAAFLDVAHNTTYGETTQTNAALVHSDLKPSNIRIASGTKEIKILDFGIAKAGWHTATTKQFGSLPYMSPERIEGHIDRHVDYWALGVVLYEMLAGELPFMVPDGASQPQRIQELILSRRPAPRLPASVPTGLQAIVSKLLRPEQTMRYQHASELKADLGAFLKGETPAAVGQFRPAHVGDTIVVPPPIPRQAVADDTIAVLPELPLHAVSDQTIIVERRPAPARLAASRVRAAVFVGALAMPALAIDACAVTRASERLSDDLRSSAVDPDAAWRRFDRIRRWAVMPMLLRDVQMRLRDTLVIAADRVLADFRTDAPAVRATNWQAARGWLEKAVSLDGSDLRIRARLECVDAHLLRIEGERRRVDGRGPAILRQAAERFEEATRLDPTIPDPYLGLARIYSFGIVDFPRASKALTEADRRGQPLGRRGHAQLGDALKARADRLRQSAFGVRGLPEERNYLQSALGDYEQALAFYDSAQGFGFVTDNVRLVRRRLIQIQRRLAEIDLRMRVGTPEGQ